jgi:hypothetical protein
MPCTNIFGLKMLKLRIYVEPITPIKYLAVLEPLQPIKVKEQPI